MIAEKAMKLYETEDTIVFRVACDCIDPEHDAHIDIEWDKKLGIIILTFEKKLALCSHWGSHNWFSEKWLRIKYAVKILYSGYVSLSESMIFLDGKHLQTFMDCIQIGIDKFKERK